MNKKLAAFAVPLLFSASLATSSAFAWDQDNGPVTDKVYIDRNVDTFAVLPAGVLNPEGITANPANGDIYVSTFTAPFKLLRYNRHGKLLAQLDFAQPLLGLEFRNHKVYICNVGNFVGAQSKIQRVNADLSGLEDVAVIPQIGSPTPPNFEVANPDGSTDVISFGDNISVPNALVFDSKGTLYVSDSFQGAVFKIANATGCNVATCKVDTLSHDGLLATVGFPPFGANGLAFNAKETVLYVANTGDDRVISLDPQTGAATVFTESLNGADGLVFDKRSGLLWVCTNQADEVVALNENGRVVAKLGEFRGINRDGTPNGLLFPASPVIIGDDMFVTNLAIALTPAVGDEPEEDVKLWTVSRLELPH
jgi:DNA-binding beta-propeller fold protein YncE